MTDLVDRVPGGIAPDHFIDLVGAELDERIDGRPAGAIIGALERRGFQHPGRRQHHRHEDEQTRSPVGMHGVNPVLDQVPNHAESVSTSVLADSWRRPGQERDPPCHALARMADLYPTVAGAGGQWSGRCQDDFSAVGMFR